MTYMKLNIIIKILYTLFTYWWLFDQCKYPSHDTTDDKNDEDLHEKTSPIVSIRRWILKYGHHDGMIIIIKKEKKMKMMWIVCVYVLCLITFTNQFYTQFETSSITGFLYQFIWIIYTYLYDR